MKLLQHIFVIQNIIDFTTLLYCSYQIGFFNDLLKKQESKILYFGCYSWAQIRKKTAKATQVLRLVKNLSVTFLFGSPIETVIVSPPTKHALHDSVSLNAVASKIATSAVIVGHSSKDSQIIYWTHFQSVNIVSFV